METTVSHENNSVCSNAHPSNHSTSSLDRGAGRAADLINSPPSSVYPTVLFPLKSPPSLPSNKTYAPRYINGYQQIARVGEG